MHVFIIAIILVYTTKSIIATLPFITTNAPMQFAVLMVSSEYVPAQTISPFFGLAHVAVIQTNTSVTVEVTIWHQIEFATLIALKYENVVTNITFSRTIASGSAASSSNCPIQTSFAGTTTLVNLLKTGGFHLDISSDGVAGGQIRGQLIQRPDLYISFISNYTYPDNAGLYKADAGMALINIYALTGQPTTPDGFVGFNVHVLSRGIPDGMIFEATTIDSNVTAAFIGVNTIGSIPVTGVIDTTDNSMLRKDVIRTPALTGIGSSNIRFTITDGNITDYRAAFIRMPRDGPFSPEQLGLGGGGPPVVEKPYEPTVPFWQMKAMALESFIAFFVCMLSAMILKMSRERNTLVQTQQK